MLILGLHKRDVPNVGDLAAGPLDYVDLAGPADEQIIAHVKTPPALKPDVVVLGGGAIAKYAPRIRKKYPKSLLIGWGLGHTSTRRAPVSRWPHLWLRRGYALWGTRDASTGLTYAPCPSCLHPGFNDAPAPQHDVVVFGHAMYSPLKDACAQNGLPYLDNLDAGGIDAAIAFLASGRTVISSSYHGAYWGTLLGRRVAAIPFGSKFYSYFHQPALVRTLEDGIAEAKAHPSALSHARTASKAFEDAVRRMIATR
ncbi:MAG: hypothetical protein AAGB11_18045 [Pseudomonadota bacterium]